MGPAAAAVLPQPPLEYSIKIRSRTCSQRPVAQLVKREERDAAACTWQLQLAPHCHINVLLAHLQARARQVKEGQPMQLPERLGY